MCGFGWGAGLEKDGVSDEGNGEDVVDTRVRRLLPHLLLHLVQGLGLRVKGSGLGFEV